MPVPNARRFLVSVLVAMLFVGILMLISGFGSFLNRSRGGFIHFGGPTNESDPAYEVWYWPSHILSRVFFALPTGLLVVSSCWCRQHEYGAGVPHYIVTHPVA